MNWITANMDELPDYNKKFTSKETNENITFKNIVTVQRWLFMSSLFNFSPSHSMEDISHYIVLLNYPSPTLVHHPSHHLSSCPINFLLQLFWMIISLETQFRDLLHINAAIMVGTMHLIWRLQPFHRYFGISLLPRVAMRYFYVVGSSCSTIILVRVSNLNCIQ